VGACDSCRSHHLVSSTLLPRRRGWVSVLLGILSRLGSRRWTFGRENIETGCALTLAVTGRSLTISVVPGVIRGPRTFSRKTDETLTRWARSSRPVAGHRCWLKKANRVDLPHQPLPALRKHASRKQDACLVQQRMRGLSRRRFETRRQSHRLR